MRPRLFDEAALIVKDGRARVKVRRTAQRSAMTHWKDSPEATAQSPMRKVSGSTVNPRLASSPYRSKLEARYATQLDLELRAGLIKGWLYEPFSLKLANGKRYRPDFLTWGEEGLTCIECKGFHRNLRDSLTHLKWAAQRFPCFIWRKVWWKDGGWDGQYIVT